MRTLYWTTRCDSCNDTSTMVANNMRHSGLRYEDPLVPTGWVRDGDRDICHECQLKAVIKRMEPECACEKDPYAHYHHEGHTGTLTTSEARIHAKAYHNFHGPNAWLEPPVTKHKDIGNI